MKPGGGAGGTFKKSGIWKYELRYWPHYLHVTLIITQQFAVKPLLCVPLECVVRPSHISYLGGGRRQGPICYHARKIRSGIIVGS